METKTRLDYIDALRGFAMLLVVYHHLVVMGLRDSGYVSPVNEVLRSFFMPLFFFISGFVSYKSGRAWTLSYVSAFLLRKARKMLIPTIVMFVLCTLFFKLDIVEYLSVSFKCGYWFTWSLFCMMFIWTVCSYLLPDRWRGGYFWLYLS